MAVRKVSARVEIDGEREYKAALGELNNGNRVLASEMRKLQAEYKNNADSMDFLNAKGDLLQRQILQQKDKVETLRNALKNAVSQQGESSAAAQAWAAKLNDAEAALVGLEQELEKTQDDAKGFDQSLAKAEDNAKLLDSEMRKLQAQYQGNTESVEYLTKENELLDRELVNQELAIDTLREKLDDARAKYGENSHEVKALKTEINDAEAAHYKLLHAIEENNEALKANDGQLKAENESLVSVGNTVDQVARKFGVRLPDGLKKALDNMQGFSAGTVLAMTTAASGVAALAKVVSELHDITKQAAADVDEILTESMTTGLSTRTIQQLKYAENLIDVSYSTITGTLTKLTQNMDKARDGNEAMAASFASLGVAIQDGTTGQLRDVESVFYEVIDALGQIENPTERDAAAMELLGKSAQELNPLILQGSSALKDYAAEAEAAGYVLDESQLKKLGEVDDAYQQLELQIDATKKELAVQFAPASKAAMETFANVTKAAGDTLARSGLVDGLADLLASLTGLLEPLAELLGITPGLTNELRPLYEILHAIAGVFALIADVGNAAIGILTLNPTKFNTPLGLNAQYGMYSNMQRWDTGSAGYRGRSSYAGWEYDPETGLYSGNYVPGNAAGDQNWRGGLTYLSENGPEAAILPRGTQILNAQDTRGLGGDTYYITIDAKNVREFNDIVEIARTARVRGRMK